MLIIDEYLAVRVLVGAWPAPLPDDEPLALPAYRHYRLLQRIHQPAAGLTYGRQLWFGTDRNIGTRLAEIAADLHIAIHVAEPA